MGLPGTVAQKLMKLFPEVSEGDCPATGGCWPLFSKPVAMTDCKRVNELCASPEFVLLAAALFPLATLVDAAACR